MPNKITFSAEPRAILGKKANRLRGQGLVPANISGNVDKTVAVSVQAKDFAKLYEEVGDTGLFYLTVTGEKAERPVLISEVQFDSLSMQPLHVVFRQVNLSEKITAEVPVEVIGELAVKDAVLVKVRDTIEVEALPADLPEKFEVDISGFAAVGDSISFAQLSFDRNKVKLMIEEAELESPVVLVQEVKEEVEEVAPAAEAPAEGAAPAADAAATPEAAAE